MPKENNAVVKPAGGRLSMVMRAVSSLFPYARNPRRNDGAIDQMCASITEFGFTVPMLVRSTGEIVDGHLRWKAALKLGMESVPVILCDGWTESQVKAFRLLVNRSVNWATWDAELVALELADLKEFQFDTSMIGFSDKELREFEAALPAYAGLTDENAVPEPPVDPVTKLGDLWILGKHRLLCGDSTKAADVARLMNGETAGLMATDPPYLIGYQGGDHPESWVKNAALKAAGKKSTKDKHWDDYHDPEQSSDFFASFIAAALPHLDEHAAVYQFHASIRQALVEEAWTRNGLHIHQQIIWVKTRPVLTRCHFMWQHEPAFYGWREGKSPKLKPPGNERTVWNVSQAGESDGIHPTQKPVELFRRPLLYHTKVGGLAYEPFSGSFTSGIAWETTGRRVYAMELEPVFVDVAVKRFSDFCGKPAILDGDGRTFDELSVERTNDSRT